MGVDGDFPNPGYDVDNFKAGAKVVAEFQVNFGNFKVGKKIITVKVYLFCLLGVYLVDNLSKETISTLKKWHLGNNK